MVFAISWAGRPATKQVFCELSDARIRVLQRSNELIMSRYMGIFSPLQVADE